MHRVTRRAPRAAVAIALGLCCCLSSAAALLAGGCAATKPVVRDQPVVEQYRLRITKVRNAIAETRATIAASRGAPYQPELYMRLAELQSEEARYHYMVAFEREQQRAEGLHVPQVRILKEQAIGTYRSILKEHPHTHLADRILFNISHEQRELGEFDAMRVTLEELVDKYPDSPYRAEALLVLGDYHFDRNKLVFAQKHYQQIIDMGDTPLLGLAMYKQAWVDVNLGDCEKALEHFEGAIEAARTLDDVDATEFGAADVGYHFNEEFEIPPTEKPRWSFAGHMTLNVQREALVDLTYCYAQEREPEKATAFLRGLASSREAYVASLGKMASRYALIEQPRGAADVSRELLLLAPDDIERLDDARMLHRVVVRMNDYSQVGDDVWLILRAMRRQTQQAELDEEARQRVETEFELMARDLATKSHRVLSGETPVEAGTKEWTKTPATAKQTARAYEVYLDVMGDSPYAEEITLNLADVLMDSDRFLEAGHRYRDAAALLAGPPPVFPDEAAGEEDAAEDAAGDEAGEGDAESEIAIEDDSEPLREATDPAARDREERKSQHSRRKQRADALYNAVVAYQRSLETERSRTHLERASARAGLREAGGEYLAVGNPEGDRSQRIKFAIAQSYYDEGSYLEAIDLLTAVAYEYPGTEQGDAAVHMVLDSYKTINDISGLITVGRRFTDPESPIAGKIKGEVVPIVEAAEQRRLDELSLAASGDQAGGMEVLMAFADRYQDSDLGERALLSTFVAARAGGDTDSLYDLGEQILEKYPKSDQLSGVASSMGQTAASRFEFDRAIEYLEKAAQMNPEQSASLYLLSGELREQLADRAGAEKDYRKAMKAAKEGGPQYTEAVVHLADLLEASGTAQQVANELRPLAKSKNPEVMSRLGLAMLRVGGQDWDAEEYLRGVVEGAQAASATATARANYGMAEIMLHSLENYEPYAELDAIEEAVSLVDVVMQSYLAAARQPDPTYSQAALARLARAAEIGAQKLESIPLPEDLSAEDRKLVREAMAKRAESLIEGRDEALAECASRAKSAYRLDEAGLACIEGRPPREDPVRAHKLKPRNKSGPLPDVDEARERLSRNPDDVDALRTVATAFLDADDAHAARLVLARVAEAGGDADDLNLLGVANYQAGDTLGALDAFGRAKDAGSGAAAFNLAAIYMELGVGDLVNETIENAPAKIDGRMLPRAREIRNAL